MARIIPGYLGSSFAEDDAFTTVLLGDSFARVRGWEDASPQRPLDGARCFSAKICGRMSADGMDLDGAIAAELHEQFPEMTDAQIKADIDAYREGTVRFQEHLIAGGHATARKRVLLEACQDMDAPHRVTFLKTILVIDRLAAQGAAWDAATVRAETVAQAVQAVEAAYAASDDAGSLQQRLFHDALHAEGVTAALMAAESAALAYLRDGPMPVTTATLARETVDIAQGRIIEAAAWHMVFKTGAVPQVPADVGALAVTIDVNAAAELRQVNGALAAGDLDLEDAEARVEAVVATAELTLISILSSLLQLGALAGVTAGVTLLLGSNGIALGAGCIAGLVVFAVFGHTLDTVAFDAVATLDRLGRLAAYAAERATEALSSGYAQVRERLSDAVETVFAARVSVEA